MGFTEKDLVNFGNYLLSDARTALIRENHPDEADFQLRKGQVHDADLSNWSINNNKAEQE